MKTYLYPRAVISSKKDEILKYNTGIAIYNHTGMPQTVSAVFKKDGVRFDSQAAEMITIAPYSTYATMLSRVLEPGTYQLIFSCHDLVFPIAYQYHTDDNGNTLMETMIREELTTVGGIAGE